MTTPAPQQQQPAAPPPPPQDGLDDAALAVAVAAILAGTLAPGITVAAAVAGLKARFILTVAALAALSAVLDMITASPPPLTGVIGPASRQVQSMNTARRAQYALAASRRVLTAEREARAKGEPVEAARDAQLARERKYYAAHQAAMWNRARAAGQVDLEAAVHGPLLGWGTILDSRTSPECRAADGKNFYASAMPLIGFPGAVHPHCRCYATSPYRNASLLPSAGKFRRANSPHTASAAAS